MAQITTLVDDLDGESKAEMTLEFGLDGRDYEIDLNDENYEEYRKALELLAAHGRLVERKAVKAKRTLSTGKKTGTMGKTQEMREWLRSQGHQVSDRGRVPQSLVELWDARPKGDDTPEPVVEPEKASETPEEANEDKVAEEAVIARVKNTPKPARARGGKKVDVPAIREVLTLVEGEK